MSEQLMEAAILLMVGMSVVFCFLTLLVGGIHSIAWFVRKYPEPQTDLAYSKASYQQNNKSSTPTTVNPTIVSAITAAVNEHRRQKQAQK